MKNKTKREQHITVKRQGFAEKKPLKIVLSSVQLGLLFKQCQHRFISPYVNSRPVIFIKVVNE